LNKVLKIVLH